MRALPPNKQQEALRLLESLTSGASSEPNGTGVDRRPIWEIVEEVNAGLRADTWENAPTDGSINLDHYLYGALNRKEDRAVAFNIQIEAPPLTEDATGALRVGNSRVLLEIVVRAFQDGATPETIVQRYSTLALPDVYAVLAYYLRHPSEVEEYLARREEKAEEVQRRIKSQQGDLSDIRCILRTESEWSAFQQCYTLRAPRGIIYDPNR